MKDLANAALSAAQNIQADADAFSARTVINGVGVDTDRPLPDAVKEYIRQWGNDPCWDIDEVEDDDLREYLPELRAYAAAYEQHHAEKFEEKVSRVTDLYALKEEFVYGRYDRATVRAAIIQAEQLTRIADLLEDFHRHGFATFSA